MGPWPSGSHQGLANHTNEEPWGQRGLLGKATAADHLCLQMQKVRMVIKCQVAMVIAIIAIIVIIAMHCHYCHHWHHCHDDVCR